MPEIGPIPFPEGHKYYDYVSTIHISSTYVFKRLMSTVVLVQVKDIKDAHFS